MDQILWAPLDVPPQKRKGLLYGGLDFSGMDEVTHNSAKWAMKKRPGCLGYMGDYTTQLRMWGLW